ncbi:class I mannose-6-phosphate isomerase [Lacinutrix sp. C3R15]|uniref:type I phosphomannose isomerase catalytic subunit n=1 Tax=Flavobacteriaceae TaxID=49546 RepID=UPI001C096D9D|nr:MULTISPECIES: type I phosphomannose isomerase catalytic subunit [Flavobacteriaceae]MBU2939471.1 class I mannose-6-phosphate isomerase [Lacinutrix sp. C3R15]MDO6622786.1 class I mannose-6-phosphate isomerase [Oceanihabitans sp. 1_MG-2023]
MLTYPIKFEPILKEKIWGGQKLKTLLNKKSDLTNIGESWEISDINKDSSIVNNGVLKGKTLKELLNSYKEELIGVKNYKVFGNTFPLLIKFIDAKKDLSIQLHPNDTLAAKRHNSFGKTEMWYVLQAEKDANLIVGFNQEMNSETYLKHLKAKTLPEILNYETVNEGDSYFIEVGQVHAIGAGVMLAEIQQTSDITYRVYDWDRVDDNGNQRELHNDLAIDAIDFNLKNDFRVNYSKTINKENEMVDCPYFTTNYLEITNTIKKENKIDSFIIYMCVSGEVEIETAQATERIIKGETVLIPAAIKTFQISSKNAKLLEVYV